MRRNKMAAGVAACNVAYWPFATFGFNATTCLFRGKAEARRLVLREKVTA
jgi:hypothetical protein